jgi:hypothetical protein
VGDEVEASHLQDEIGLVEDIWQANFEQFYGDRPHSGVEKNL